MFSLLVNSDIYKHAMFPSGHSADHRPGKFPTNIWSIETSKSPDIAINVMKEIYENVFAAVYFDEVYSMRSNSLIKITNRMTC